MVAGASTRSGSVRAGLDAVPTDVEVVLVHDAARPLASPDLFAAVVAAVVDGVDGVVPAVPLSDTVKRVSGGVVVETIDRTTLVTVQTPQGFRAGALREAHRDAGDASDDAALLELRGGRWSSCRARIRTSRSPIAATSTSPSACSPSAMAVVR